MFTPFLRQCKKKQAFHRGVNTRSHVPTKSVESWCYRILSWKSSTFSSLVTFFTPLFLNSFRRGVGGLKRTSHCLTCLEIVQRSTSSRNTSDHRFQPCCLTRSSDLYSKKKNVSQRSFLRYISVWREVFKS